MVSFRPLSACWDDSTCAIMMAVEVVVVDTSVFVAALKSAGGASRQILRLCLAGQLQPVFGQKLFLEFEDLMGRTALFGRCPISKSEREMLFDGLLADCKWVDIHFLWRPNLPDEADNHVLELAIASGATTVITHNLRDFMGELKFPEVRICTPATFLNVKR